jgi:hypothetical protein
MRWGTLVVVALALFACAATPASAARSFVAVGPKVDQVALAGDGIVWVEHDLGRDWTIRRSHVRHRGGDGRTRTLRQFDAMLGPRYFEYRRMELAASASHVVVAVDETALTDAGPDPADEYPTFSQLRSAPLAGSSSTVVRTCPRGGGPNAWADLDGHFAALLDRPCAGRSAPVLRIRDLRTGRQRTIAAPKGRRFEGLALAGRYVLARESRSFEYGEYERTSVSLYDRTTGRRVLSFAGEDGLGPAYDDFDVARDGTIAVAYPGPDEEDQQGCFGANRVVVLSPRAPQPTLQPDRACFGEPRLVGDWVVYDRFVGYVGGEVPPESEAGGRTLKQLVAHNLHDGRERALTMPALGVAALEEDGRHALVGIRACGERGTRYTHLAIAELLAGPPLPIERCIARFPADSAAVGPRGHVKLPVECPRGCISTTRVWLPDEGRNLRFRQFEEFEEIQVGADFIHVQLDRGQDDMLPEVRIAPDELEALRARGERAAELRVEVTQPDGAVRSYTRAITLRAASER